ncbi:MAG TPA: HD domain-containing phosphohydrolase [Thermodesulfovibrionia bacterium]|nr:HD domain-containing phosphohydrolase [Thermodesulfovibrionia bacterium]
MYEGHIQQRHDAPLLLFSEDDKVIRILEKLFRKSNLSIIPVRSKDEWHQQMTVEVSIILWDLRFYIKHMAELAEPVRELTPDSIHVGLIMHGTGKYLKSTLTHGVLNYYIDITWDEEYLLYTVRQVLNQCNLLQQNKSLSAEVQEQKLRLEEVHADIEQRMERLIGDFEEKRKSLVKDNESLIRQKTRIFEVLSMLTDINNAVANHSRNVAALSKLMAEALALSAEEIQRIVQASLLHDIGKMNIPLTVLGKAKSQLNAEEEEMVRSHVVRGQLLVERMECSKEVERIIRHHHEWYDGNGYPDGLKGESIPLGARIIAVADTIENMTNNNTPWNQFSLRRALWLIESKSAVVYDPKVYKCLLRVVKQWAEEAVYDADCQEEIVSLHDLKAGRKVSRDVISGTGILFVPRGTRLTHNDIEELAYYDSIDPLKTGVYIWKETKKAIHQI